VAEEDRAWCCSGPTIGHISQSRKEETKGKDGMYQDTSLSGL